MTRRRWAGLLRRRAVRRAAAGLAIASVAGAAWIRLGSLPAGLLAEADAVRSTTVFDRNGEVLYEARSDLGTRELRLRADRLPPPLVGATLAAEDHRFHSHWGVDPIAMARATWRNVVALDRVEGGSTLTQQVAKLLLDRRTQLASGTPRRRGWGAKIEEAVVALRLEHRLSKAEILALYLNLAPYGNQIAGAERASHAYFGTDASMLTPAQAAFVAALPQRPSRFNPWRNLAQATARQRVVLARMERRGFLPAAAAAVARAERLRLAEEDARFLAPHFVGMVLGDLPDPKPSRVVTTLDASLQRAIEGIVRSQRPLLEKHGATNVAVVVLDNTTSQWLAWEGSGNYGSDRGGSINGPTSLRQPGSALKPFTYALAFESGANPASVVPDVPASFPTAEDGVIYTPRNYDGRFRGPLLARAALAGSINVPAVSLAADLGVPNVLRFLRRAGFTTFDKNAAYYGLGLTLGNAEVRLDELTAAYAAFARAGEWRAPRARLDPEPRLADPVQLVSPRTAYWVTDILADDGAREFIFGRGSQLEFPFPVAVKTGTSQAYHDNWTIGSSRHVTVGVWVGNFDRSPLIASSGVTGAGPLFHAVMLAAEARAAGGITPNDDAVLDPPTPLAETTICALSGMRAGEACPVRRRERLAPDAPQVAGAACSWHQASHGELVTLWPERYRGWAEANGLRSPREPEVEARVARGEVAAPRGSAAAARGTASASAGVTRASAGLQVTHPAAGTVFLIDPTLRAEFQAVPFRAAGAGDGEVSWTVNGRAVGSASADAAVLWPLQRGSHVAVVRDVRGRTAVVSFVVK
ncbi:MAG: penicillin-binding protein 1C [Vicinamibacteraceae bacterium]